MNKALKQQNLTIFYELGKQAAWNDASFDDYPRYRNLNKTAAWLKGFTDAEQEKQRQELTRQVDKAGIAKLKAIIAQKQELS